MYNINKIVCVPGNQVIITAISDQYRVYDIFMTDLL